MRVMASLTPHYDSTCQCTIIDQFYVDVLPWLGHGAGYGPSIPWQAYEADPVNTATGNYAYQRLRSIHPHPFAAAGLQPGLQLGPRHSNGPLGYGWTHTYNISANENPADGSVTVRHGDGPV